MYVIGTAGHVDHGKSTLVKALTDIDPDRLPEEKAREMTVDLGFAWMTLPSGREVSIVDVPGHERFIKNMLAGVGAIDLAMLIVAADESVMPQTREHLAILDILQVRRNLVVITKTDLVDEEMVELVMAEVEDALKGTSFENSAMVGVSANTGAGLDDLRSALDGILDDTEARRDLGRPRLPVDRCFTISGFGTVVTGTLIDGVLAVGQEVELAPSGRRGRIRGLQSHKTKVENTQPGVRLAVNISGLARTEVQRGEILTTPGWLRPTRRLDAQLRMVRGAPHSLRHNEGVTFHLFTSETTARVRLLDADRLAPGAEGWVQILLNESLPMVKGDFFVIRSAEDTLGGGQVVDPNPRRRHRRFSPEVEERLMMLDQGTGEDILLSVAEQWGPCDLTTLSRRSNLPASEVVERTASLVDDGDVVVLGELGTDNDAVVYSAQGWDILKSKMFVSLQTYHGQYPLRRGAPVQEIRSRLGLSQPAFTRALARLAGESYVVEEAPFLRLPGHQVTLTPKMQQQVAEYLKILGREPYTPPGDQPLEAELLGVLIDQGQVVRVNPSVVFTAAAYREMADRVVSHLQSNESITVAEARTMFNSSRKYVLPLLEYLDQQHITRRVGDERVLR
ncbi:MAG: selenocysteine-specific translation elongation factor [Dehalococcoidia bacterium]|jgi:selenocysteine-specific elongation factor|nr:selenocysteine-specific translation elongation factor [Dehalococcoidia bacterium]MDP7083798.1 selenocysteine-specific translation elongation factor [Dehalococcoidia bacterium]MDP7201098.1 selenocysteine-specific translation elongation factor [Dehalococcoidia bacterium]